MPKDTSKKEETQKLKSALKKSTSKGTLVAPPSIVKGKTKETTKTRSSQQKTKLLSGESEDLEQEEILLEEYDSSSSSSDDEDDMVYTVLPLDVDKLPTIARDDASVKRKLENAKRNPAKDRGVVYLGRIPHGFYEDQMRAYFNQFGDVARLRLSRNKKTGRSKHYAFIEFDSSAVAQIVSETMDNYLLMGHILVCKTIPNDKVHPELWVSANRKWRVIPAERVARVAHNKDRTEEERAQAEARLLKRQENKRAKILDAGIDYDFSSVAYDPSS